VPAGPTLSFLLLDSYASCLLSSSFMKFGQKARSPGYFGACAILLGIIHSFCPVCQRRAAGHNPHRLVFFVFGLLGPHHHRRHRSLPRPPNFCSCGDLRPAAHLCSSSALFLSFFPFPYPNLPIAVSTPAPRDRKERNQDHGTPFQFSF
jgi:hypothetical protein